MSLPKSVSTITLLSSAVAGIIGSGWLLSPLATAKIAGPAAILAWIIGGILMMIVASTFVILTRILPVTGGTVRFFQLTHGHFAGFGFSWIAWLAWVAVAPIEMLAIIQYSTNYLPDLMTTGTTRVLTTEGLCVAATGLVIIAIINSLGMKTYARLNHVILAIKLIIPITAAILLLSTHFHMQNFTTEQGFMPFGIKSVLTALPMAGVIYSFIGFNPVVELAAEAKSPRESIPIAIFGALFICMIIYVLVQCAFIAALPASSLQQGWSAIAFAGDAGPFAGLLTLLGFVWFVKALYLDACISPYGTALVQSMSTSRIAYAMSQNGYFPAYFMHANKNGIPIRAIILNTIVGFLFFLPFPSWQHMVGFLVSCLVLGYVVGPLSLMALMQQQSDLFQLRKIVIHTICLIAFIICNYLIYWSGWQIVFKILILFAIGYMILGVTMLQRKGFAAHEKLNFKQGAWILPYLFGMGLISYFGSFGGNHIISFGIDFIVVTIFSIGIYLMAFYLTRKIVLLAQMR